MNDHKFLVNLGYRIKQLRLERKMTQNDLAILCEFEKASMSRIESGKTNVSVLTLRKIVKALGIKMADVFTE